MSKKQIIFICIGIVLLILIAIGVHKFSGRFDKEVIANEIEEAPDSIRLKMVGDSLIHNSIYFDKISFIFYNHLSFKIKFWTFFITLCKNNDNIRIEILIYDKLI